MKIQVDWCKPDEIPNVPVGETEEFWVASSYTSHNGEKITSVFVAQFVNMPVNFDDNGEPDTDYYLCDNNGDPISCVGWFSNKGNFDITDYYEPLFLFNGHVLLGWAEFEKPDFTEVK